MSQAERLAAVEEAINAVGRDIMTLPDEYIGTYLDEEYLARLATLLNLKASLI